MAHRAESILVRDNAPHQVAAVFAGGAHDEQFLFISFGDVVGNAHNVRRQSSGEDVVWYRLKGTHFLSTGLQELDTAAAAALGWLGRCGTRDQSFAQFMSKMPLCSRLDARARPLVMNVARRSEIDCVATR